MSPAKKSIVSKVGSGDIYRIPLPSGVSAFAKVFYVSRFFRDVMFIGVTVTADGSHLATDRADFSAGRFYTSVAVPAYLGWQYITNAPVSSAEAELTRRIVGGEVWLGDVEIGPASVDDNRTLPRMLVLGGAVLQKKLYRIFDAKA